jgi:hypothetical protein
MDATMVPACSEVTADSPAVTITNLTNGKLSDAELQTWVKEDEEFWTLFEWGEQHGQADFLQFLYDGASNNAVTFVRNGGKIVDTPPCEYLERVDALTTTGPEMTSLTNGSDSQPGIAYVGASVGPCSSTWTSATGAQTVHTLAVGQSAWEVDVTSSRTNSALGQYLLYQAGWPQGQSGAADDLIAEAQAVH